MGKLRVDGRADELDLVSRRKRHMMMRMRMRMWMWLTMTSDEETANMMLLDAVRSSRTHQILKHDDDASTDRSRP